MCPISAARQVIEDKLLALNKCRHFHLWTDDWSDIFQVESGHLLTRGTSLCEIFL